MAQGIRRAVLPPLHADLARPGGLAAVSAAVGDYAEARRLQDEAVAQSALGIAIRAISQIDFGEDFGRSTAPRGQTAPPPRQKPASAQGLRRGPGILALSADLAAAENIARAVLAQHGVQAGPPLGKRHLDLAASLRVATETHPDIAACRIARQSAVAGARVTRKPMLQCTMGGDAFTIASREWLTHRVSCSHDPRAAFAGRATQEASMTTSSKRMANPWLKKNPLMSMWLSGANAAAGRARSVASAEASKQQAALIKQTVRFWTGAWQSAVKPRRHR